MAEKKIAKSDECKQKNTENLFSKNQLLSSKRFQDRRDILNAVLKSDKQYTVGAVEEEISRYMKGKVK